MRKSTKNLISVFMILILSVSVVFSPLNVRKVTAEDYDDKFFMELMITNRLNYYDTTNIYNAVYESRSLDFGDLPIISYKGVMLVRAKKICDYLGCTYSQNDTTLNVKKGNINLNMTIDSDIAYVNGKKIIMDAAPTRVANRTGTNSYYAVIPLEFFLEVLGFDFSYDFDTKTYYINTNFYTGAFEYNSFLQSINTEISNRGNTNVNVADNELFSYSMLPEFETVVEQSRRNGTSKSFLTEVAGYSLNNSDAFVLFGVDIYDINVTLDGNMLIVTLPGTGNTIGNELYMSDENNYLNYCLISGDLSTSTIITYLEADQTYYVYDSDPDYVSVHITNEFVSEKDNGYSLSEAIKPSGGTSDIIGGTDSPGESGQEISLPDDCILIPLPEGTSIKDVTDTDNYLNYNFVIKIRTNIADFLKENGIKNPYSFVEGYVIKYNSTTGYTNISFDTKIITAYEYEIVSGYLVLKVARPDEIYSKIVLMDAGHGGSDPGASANGTKEKDLNFTIVNTYCKEYFEQSDIKVYFTRTTDVLISLEERAIFADDVCADFFISVHMNSNNSSSPNGTEVFYSINNNRMQPNGLMSQDIARSLVDNLSKALGTKNRGITSENFYVVKYNRVPAVLIETGFISNSGDYKILTDAAKQRKAAETIFNTCKQLFIDYPTSR